MLRLILIQAFLFLLPFIVYGVFLRLSKRDARDRSNWDGVQGRLVIGGLVLAIVGLLALTLFDGADPGAVYRSPVYKDGKIVPGHFE